MYSQTVTPTNTPQEWAPASGARSRRISVPYGRARPRAPRGVCSSVPRPSLGSSTGTHAALRRCRVPWSISIASRRAPDPVVPALGDDSRSGTGARRRWGVRLPPAGTGSRHPRRLRPRCSSTIGSRPWRTTSSRRSRDRATEEIDHPRQFIEAAPAHVSANKILHVIYKEQFTSYLPLTFSVLYPAI